MNVIKASEPADYIWSNLGSDRKKYRIRRMINFVVFLIFCSSFGILVGIKRLIKVE
jgi:hypothetical protein